MAENSRKNEFFERESIAIIAILAAILMPALSQARERGKQATCINNMKSFGIAIAHYSISVLFLTLFIIVIGEHSAIRQPLSLNILHSR